MLHKYEVLKSLLKLLFINYQLVKLLLLCIKMRYYEAGFQYHQ
ncbi:hypothetical protein XNW1_3130002 [Xenorhabdus nematophila str. Websteri]|nr:hypothetical protein XNW1_3130002 [Xenorhabdus nematophila str. Websteri]